MNAVDTASLRAAEVSLKQRYQGGFAWPTVILALAVLSAFVAVSALVGVGVLPLWAAFLINTVVGYVAFTPMHDASHAAVHGRHARFAWVGELVGWVSGAILFSPYEAFRILHTRHHSATNDPERDPDYWVVGKTWLGTLLRCATIMPAYYVSFYRRTGGAETPMLRRARLVSLLALVGFIATVIAFAVAGYGAEVMLLWVAPAFTALTALAWAFDYIPHRPHNVRERYYDSQVLLFPGLSVAMTAQNYHLVHHLYPRIPFYAYGAAFRDIRGELERLGAPIVELTARS